ncbi:3-hydroxy-3-methylglutaryl-coenzyme A reductase 1 [[Candida] railenensis]|uniref:3-hydroxy-3-methylglutaryl coenzyme A reductase n=1 Tax=[Candida] railenensis TaxID=45579 RepID=A0A9P0QM04_9ASCO|nr:3-hydroxy-3-methylglutaryl-coenzyme A reductase 1 [[Candida] railenensis]
MLTLVKRGTTALASISAHRPIHVILITALFASVAYLSVVDEYIPEFFRADQSLSYYHPPSSSQNFNDWIPISNDDIINSYPEAEHLVMVSLRFKRSHNNPIPEISDSFRGSTENERILITKNDSIDTKLDAIDKITSSEGITWKARHHNRITKYYEYVKYGITNLKESISNAENFDIGLISLAYLAMWYTLLKVFFDMRQIGSNFWLGFSTLSSSSFAFLFALFLTTRVLDVKVPMLSLTEGIPFLVAIIGFKHKISIASVVMKNSQLTGEDAKTIVSNAISGHSLSLLRDNLVAIGALTACSILAPQVNGLAQFCTLSAIILSFDLILVYTFYSAILALKVEINRARRTEDLKIALEEEGVSSLVAQNVALSSSAIEFPSDGQSFLVGDNSIISFKTAMIAVFVGFQIFLVGGGSWISDDTYKSFTSNFSNLVFYKSTAKHIPIDKANGTIVTLITPRIYMPMGFLVESEDYVLLALEKISLAIRDKIISKCLLFGFALSISINAYFMNASRYQATATRKLIESAQVNEEKVNSIQTEKVLVASKSKESKSAVPNGHASHSLLPLEDCVKILNDGKVTELNDNEISTLVVAGKLPLYSLEKKLADNTRAVAVRRKAVAKLANAPVLDTERLPYEGYDYDRVYGACCENVIGYMPIPVGIAGPLIIDGKPTHIPMATTEGCLVASAMRGCKAINAGGGVQTVLTQDGMTRGPCVSFPTLARAGAAKIWLDSEEGQTTIKKAFNSTSRFARLQHIKTAMAGTLLFIRFRTTTGDAMGMNMISKGVEYSLKYMVEECGWSDMDVISVSGNYCTDKKPAAINWIEGRGKSVVAEARIPADVVRKVLKSDVAALVELNTSKNLIGSAMAGSIGGFNAQAANLVTAVFLACGQDPAQNVESSNCITLMNNIDGDLQISVSMPSIEVGTIGGGTILQPQGAMLDLLGVRGPHPTKPGENARQLAKIVASAVLAAELSLCSALAAGHLVQSHMQHNRAGATAATAAPTSKPIANGNGNGNGTSNGATAADIARLKEGAVNCIRS